MSERAIKGVSSFLDEFEGGDDSFKKHSEKHTTSLAFYKAELALLEASKLPLHRVVAAVVQFEKAQAHYLGEVG